MLVRFGWVGAGGGFHICEDAVDGDAGAVVVAGFGAGGVEEERAAAADELAVSGSFVFVHLAPDALKGKVRQAFAFSRSPRTPISGSTRSEFASPEPVVAAVLNPIAQVP